MSKTPEYVFPEASLDTVMRSWAKEYQFKDGKKLVEYASVEWFLSPDGKKVIFKLLIE